MLLNTQEYQDKVLGCWLGKNIGGTLGAPFEWRRQVNDVSFYTQDLAGDPLPNDDLDIQLLWLVALEERGIDLDAHTLGEYWLLYVTPHWVEYGTAKINMRAGLLPPLSGSLNNEYRDSCGSFIRSEIWACIAPGLPRIAAKYAYEDAIIDHGMGEGVYAEVFTAALESAAFVEKDLEELIEIGLSYIPADCAVAGAIRCAIESYRTGKTWLEARHEMLANYRGSAFMNSLAHVSLADQENDFHIGKRGWDVPSNIGMLLIGLLYGEGDFSRTLCVAVDCGEDTDCTAATAGSIFGIIYGSQGIPERWIAPIGRRIKTACLNLGELGSFGGQLPQDVDDLTARTTRIARQVLLHQRQRADFCEGSTVLSEAERASLYGYDYTARLYESFTGVRYRFDWCEVTVDCGEAPLISAGLPKPLRVRIRNTYKLQANINLHWILPAGWQMLPSTTAMLFSAPWEDPKEACFQVLADNVPAGSSRLILELTIDGRPTTMLVPVTLLNGNI